MNVCVCARASVLFEVYRYLHHFTFHFSFPNHSNNPNPETLAGVRSPILVRFDAVTWTVTFWADNEGAKINLWDWTQKIARERQQRAIVSGRPAPPPVVRTRVLDVVPFISCTPGVKLKFNPTLGSTELSAMRSMPCDSAKDVRA